MCLSHYLARSLRHHRYFTTAPCHLVLSSGALVHPCPLFNIVFPPLLHSRKKRGTGGPDPLNILNLPTPMFFYYFFFSHSVEELFLLNQKTLRHGQTIFHFWTTVRSSSFSNGCFDLSANLFIGYVVLVRNVQ